MSRLDLPKARDLMATQALAIDCQGALLDAIDQLIAHQLPAATVVDKDGKLCGMLTEKDCLRILASLTYDPEPGHGIVEKYQSEVACVCDPDMDIFRVAELFLSNHFPVLPVIENDELIGTISRAAMLRGIQLVRSITEKNQQEFEKTAGHQADRPRSIEALQKAAASTSPEQLSRLLGRKQ